MPTTIQLRRGTTQQWTAVNPILSDGEIGWDSTLKKIKVGNGSSSWTALEYQGDADLDKKITAFPDPNADRLIFWDDSAGSFAPLTASTGLTISGTNLTVNAASETVSGRVELATEAETTTGTDKTRAIHPAGLKAQIGKASGIAGLDANGKIPSSQLPAAQIGTSLMGTYAQRPSALLTSAGTIYYATDTMESYRCGDTSWTVIAAGSELGAAELRTLNKTMVTNTWVDVPGMAVTWVIGERPFRVIMSADICSTVAGGTTLLRTVLNGNIPMPNTPMNEISITHEKSHIWHTGHSTTRWYGIAPGEIITVKMQARCTAGELWIDGNTSNKVALLSVEGV